VAKQKPPLLIRVWTDRGAAGLSRSVTGFSPKQLRREGMEKARFKAEVMKRKRRAVVYNVVKDDIGEASDAKCADLHFDIVNAKLKETARHVIVDIIRKEPDRVHRRREVTAVKKTLARFPTKSALAKMIARIRRKAG
jgi:hypothetical protein